MSARRHPRNREAFSGRDRIDEPADMVKKRVECHWPCQGWGASMGWQIGIKPMPAGAVEEHRLHFIHHVAVVQIAAMKHQDWPSRTALLVVDINAVYMCQHSYIPRGYNGHSGG